MVRRRPRRSADHRRGRIDAAVPVADGATTMTFQPVLPPVVLLVIAAVVIALRLLTMRRLHTTAGARWATVWRWSGLTLAVLLILIAAARPGIEHGERGAAAATRSAENTNVFFVVDRSADTAVEDYGDRQSRMSGIRSDIEALIDQYPRARFAPDRLRVPTVAGLAAVRRCVEPEARGRAPRAVRLERSG